MIYPKTLALAGIGTALVGFTAGAYLRGMYADEQIAKLREAAATQAAEQAANHLRIQQDFDRRLSNAITERDRAVADSDAFRAELHDALERMRVEADAMSAVSMPGTPASSKDALGDRSRRLVEVSRRGAQLRKEAASLLERAERIATKGTARADALAAIVTTGASKQ